MASKRYYALDVLRGMTIALMILVNNPGSWSSIYAPFKHASWSGFTPTDWVFPTFLFVMGNAMSFSMRKYERLGEREVFRKIGKRSFLIFLIGLLLAAFPFVYHGDDGLAFKNLLNIRIMGVLQRIALCYLAAALLIHFFKMRTVIVTGIGLLLAYWGIMYGFGTHPDPYSLEHNAALKLDLFVFREVNMYKGYGITFDPEGLLSTLPAIVNVIAGYVAGKYIQQSDSQWKTIVRFILFGIILIALGLVWDTVFPINKPIWTSSYVLYSTGWALLVLSLLIYITEIQKFKKWSYFFIVFGKNPLFIYALSGVFAILLGFIKVGDTSLHGWIYQHGFLSWLEGENASLAFGICFIVVMWAFGVWLDKKKIYIKV